MEKKIRLINIERSLEGINLFNKRAQDSAVAKLEDSLIFYPGIMKDISTAKVDIIAFDINLPCNVMSFIKEIKSVHNVKILLTCDFVQPDLIFNCLLSGASGYVEKYCSKNKFEQTLKDCSENLIYLPLSIIGLFYARSIIHETDVTLKNIFSLLAKGFLLNDVTLQTGLSEYEIKQSIFLSLHR